MGNDRNALPAISLTFDDGPDPLWTPRVLDALRAAGARATFFVLSDRAAQHRDVVGWARAEGHRVELHGEAHLRHPDVSRAAVERDTDRALATLGRIGVKPSLWRLPWGRAAAWTEDVARERSLRLVRWTADTHDWRGDGAWAMLGAIRARLRPGAVVLAHDGLGPGARRAGCEQTVNLVGLVAAHARRRGWGLEALA